MKYTEHDLVLRQTENCEYSEKDKNWLVFIVEDHRSENRERITVNHFNDISVQDCKSYKQQDKEFETRHLFELTDSQLAKALKSEAGLQ